MQQISEAIHILYAADDRLAPVLGVSLASLLAQSKDVEHSDFSIFAMKISNRNREALRTICEEYDRDEPCFISMDNLNELLGDHIKADCGSIMQYARLFIGRLPFEKVIYLDCDVMFRRSVKTLWNTDLQGKTLAAIPDIFSRYYRKSMELEPTAPIYNDGVMLVDLEKWRMNHVEEKAIDFIHRHYGNPIKSDLGVVNAVLSRDTAAISPKWNAVTAFFDFTYEEMITYRRPPDYYSEEQIQDVILDPYIVHFTSSFCSFRPWEEGCKHPFAKEWIDTRERTPWAGTDLQKPNRSLGTRIINALPWPVAIRIATCLQVYVRPIRSQVIERSRRIGRQ